MNILVLFQSPWWNAAAYYSYNLVKALQQNSHKTIFVGDSDLPAVKKIPELGIKVYHLNLFVNSPFKFLSNIRRIKKIISDENIELLIPISAPGHIIAGIMNKFYKLNNPIVKVCLDNMPPASNILNRYLHNKLTDYFIFPGNATKKRYDKIFNIAKYKILHAPLDLKEFTNFYSNSNVKKELNIPVNKTIVSFIGRFSPEKGIYFLLDIIKYAIEKTDNIFFILSGSEEPIRHTEISGILTGKGLENSVKIVDKAEDVRNLISITDIGLLSSRSSEFICRIAMEFMAFGKPVVAPDLNVIPEVVENDVTGFIYNLNDSKMAAEVTIRIAKNGELCKNMGLNGFERIKNVYDITVFQKELEKIFSAINISNKTR